MNQVRPATTYLALSAITGAVAWDFPGPVLLRGAATFPWKSTGTDWAVSVLPLLTLVALFSGTLALRALLRERHRWGEHADVTLMVLQTILLLAIAAFVGGHLAVGPGNLPLPLLVLLLVTLGSVFRFRYLLPAPPEVGVRIGEAALATAGLLLFLILGAHRAPLQIDLLAAASLATVVFVRSRRPQPRSSYGAPVADRRPPQARTPVQAPVRGPAPAIRDVGPGDVHYPTDLNRLGSEDAATPQPPAVHGTLVAASRLDTSGNRPPDMRFRTFDSVGNPIVGQQPALHRIELDLQQALSGLARDPKRPLWSFLFLGPSGVGKTETAKLIAKAIYGDEHRIARFNMGESRGEGTQWRAFGPPPGYVGSQHGGLLTAQIRKFQGACVILLDEVEKGAQEILDALLAALDEGYIDDGSSGIRIPVTQSIFVMTGNIMGDRKDLATRSEEALRADLIQAQVVRDTQASTPFRPEFIGRIQRIVPFAPIGEAHLELLLCQTYQQVALQLQEHLRIDAPCMTEDTLQLLKEKLDHAEGGARQVRRVVTQLFFDFVTEHGIRDVPGPVFWHFDRETSTLQLLQRDALDALFGLGATQTAVLWREACTSHLLRVPA
ncbi:MAG: AAA family ATPase [Acidimicrobiales bacterium]